MTTFNNLISRDRITRHAQLGASMVEYALLLALIAMIAFAALQVAGTELSSTYSDIADNVQDPP